MGTLSRKRECCWCREEDPDNMYACMECVRGRDRKIADLQTALQEAQTLAAAKKVCEAARMVCVPREPTEAMINAGDKHIPGSRADAIWAYKAMLSAAAQAGGG